MGVATLEPDFSVSVEGHFEEGEAQRLGKFAFDVTKALAEGCKLNISKLKKIVISPDFASALQKVTSEYNHKAPSSFTQSKQATAAGQLVTKTGPDGQPEEFTLVLSTSFFVALFNEEGRYVASDEGVKIALHLLHHELIHVHEKNTLTCLLGGFNINEYGDALLISSTRVWSEYFANFMASTSVQQETVNDFLDNLLAVLNEVPLEIEKLVLSYAERDLPLDEMYFEVKKRIRLIVNSYGYAFGYVDGVGIDLSVYFPELATALSGSKLSKPLGKLYDALRELMVKYKNNDIEGYDDFSELSEAIDSIFTSFGLTLTCADMTTVNAEFHIHVA